MSLFEKFITEGNEKADELAKEGGVGRRFYGTGTNKYNPPRERRSARSLAVCSQFSLLGGRLEDSEELKLQPKESGSSWTRKGR